jgi:hypothetical protein
MAVLRWPGRLKECSDALHDGGCRQDTTVPKAGQQLKSALRQRPELDALRHRHLRVVVTMEHQHRIRRPGHFCQQRTLADQIWTSRSELNLPGIGPGPMGRRRTAAIPDELAKHIAAPTPYVWTNTAEVILTKIGRDRAKLRAVKTGNQA